MAGRAQLKDLISDRFLSEIHHLLWTDPGVPEDRFDPGWSCRDHAWATGLLARSLGYESAFVHGEAFFTTGGTARSAGHCMTQADHTWLKVNDVGIIDLSVRPDGNFPGTGASFPIKCVFANDLIPRRRNKVHFVASRGEFARLTQDLARNSNQTAAVYLPGKAEPVGAEHLGTAAQWIDSILTRKLTATYGDPTDVYAALFLHLRGFLDGTSASLAALPVDEAWKSLWRARENAAELAALKFDPAVAHA